MRCLFPGILLTSSSGATGCEAVPAGSDAPGRRIYEPSSLCVLRGSFNAAELWEIDPRNHQAWLIEGPLAAASYPSWSVDRSCIALLSRSELLLVDTRLGRSVAISVFDPDPESEPPYPAPTWSASGREIAYTDHFGTRIARVGVPGDSRVERQAWYPMWLSSGDKPIHLGSPELSRRESKEERYVGRLWKRRTPLGPRWARDEILVLETWLDIASQQDEHGYLWLDISRGTTTPVGEPAGARQANVSPFGQDIAWITAEGGLWFTGRLGDHARKVTMVGPRYLDEGCWTWSPDGGELAFVHGGDVHVCDVLTGALRRITRFGDVLGVAW